MFPALDPALDPVRPYAQLLRLSDDIGVVEHARGLHPRTHTGYCVDDVARAVVVLARDEALPDVLRPYALTLVDFVVSAVAPDGRVHNRRPYGSRSWSDEPACGDWWGRAVWALGVVVRSGRDPSGGALRAFERAASRRPAALRAMAYAGVGAAELLRRHPGHVGARSLLEAATAQVGEAVAAAADTAGGSAADTAGGSAADTAGGSAADTEWPWPEPRLRYANAVLPEVLVVGGELLGDRGLLRRGTDLLEWLLDVETGPAGHLSVTPVAGWATGEPRPGFDQQPIEVAALAEACAQAFAVTGDDRWRGAVMLAEEWFDGRNDVGVPVADETSGGGHDGLTRTGVNDNEGAESTLALLAVRHLARKVARTRRCVAGKDARSA